MRNWESFWRNGIGINNHPRVWQLAGQLSRGLTSLFVFKRTKCPAPAVSSQVSLMEPSSSPAVDLPACSVVWMGGGCWAQWMHQPWCKSASSSVAASLNSSDPFGVLATPQGQLLVHPLPLPLLGSSKRKMRHSMVTLRLFQPKNAVGHSRTVLLAITSSAGLLHWENPKLAAFAKEFGKKEVFLKKLCGVCHNASSPHFAQFRPLIVCVPIVSNRHIPFSDMDVSMGTKKWQTLGPRVALDSGLADTLQDNLLSLLRHWHHQAFIVVSSLARKQESLKQRMTLLSEAQCRMMILVLPNQCLIEQSVLELFFWCDLGKIWPWMTLTASPQWIEKSQTSSFPNEGSWPTGELTIWGAPTAATAALATCATTMTHCNVATRCNFIWWNSIDLEVLSFNDVTGFNSWPWRTCGGFAQLVHWKSHSASQEPIARSTTIFQSWWSPFDLASMLTMARSFSPLTLEAGGVMNWCSTDVLGTTVLQPAAWNTSSTHHFPTVSRISFAWNFQLTMVTLTRHCSFLQFIGQIVNVSWVL